MHSERRRRVWKAIGAAVALAGTLAAAPGQAHASSGESVLIVGLGVTLVGLAGSDIAFAAHDFDAASRGYISRDGWLTAQTIVSAPQTLAFNALLFGLNTDRDNTTSSVATAIGTLPTAGVTALTIHGLWGLSDPFTGADSMAGISVIAGTNFALTMAALGKATRGRIHPRGIGIFETVLSAPCAIAGAYESGIGRPQQGAWIALTAWSSALVVHGIVSTIVDDDRHPPEIDPRLRRENPAPLSDLQKPAHSAFGPASFTLAPTVLSNGATPVPGLVAMGTF